MTLQPKPLDKFKSNLDNLITQNIKALPSDVNSDRLKLNALMYIGQDKTLTELAQSNSALLAQIVYNFVALGLDMSNKECYIIPFGSKPTIIIDYKGLEKLAKKYSVKPIKKIYSRVVCANDQQGFDDEGNFYHKFNPFDSDEKRGTMIGSYAKVIYQDGSDNIEFVNLDEIKRVRSVSKSAAGANSVWNTWTESMYRKTAMRKLMKVIPLEFGKYQETLEKAFKEADNDFSPNERLNNDEVIIQNEPTEIIDVDFTEKVE